MDSRIAEVASILFRVCRTEEFRWKGRKIRMKIFFCDFEKVNFKFPALILKFRLFSGSADLKNPKIIHYFIIILGTDNSERKKNLQFHIESCAHVNNGGVGKIYNFSITFDPTDPKKGQCFHYNAIVGSWLFQE